MKQRTYAVTGATGHVGARVAERRLAQSGMSAGAARVMVDMIRGFNEGHIVPVEARSPANTTAPPIETFAREEFAKACAARGDGRGTRPRACCRLQATDGIPGTRVFPRCRATRHRSG